MKLNVKLNELLFCVRTRVCDFGFCVFSTSDRQQCKLSANVYFLTEDSFDVCTGLAMLKLKSNTVAKVFALLSVDISTVSFHLILLPNRF